MFFFVHIESIFKSGCTVFNCVALDMESNGKGV